MSAALDAAISILFFGLAYGMVLYLVSVGLSVTMGLMGFVNLAHGVFAAAGGYFATSLMLRFGVPFLPAVAGGVVGAAVLAVPLERLLYRPLYGRDELDQVLLTIGLIFMSVAGAKFFWGSVPLPFQPPDWLSGYVTIDLRQFPSYRSFVIVFGAAIFVGLWLGLERTRFGAQIRAAVDNRAMAQSVGINTSQLFTWTFALGSGLAALGGSLGAAILAIEPGYPLVNLVYFLIVVSIGGLGSIRGPFFAAMLVGVAVNAFQYLLPEFGDFFIYALTLVVLLVRPQGLFGRA